MSNHRSIRREQELVLLPAYHDEEPAVTVAAVYGANASGKSNLLDALRFMALAVRDSFGRWAPDGGVPRKPFKLDPAAADEPSLFVVELLTEGVRYTYGFAVDDDRVLEEWLYSYPEKRKRILFERENDEIKVGTTVPELATRLELLRGLMRPNALFLSLAAQSNIDQLMPVYRCFADALGFRTRPSSYDLRRVVDFLRSSPAGSARFIELVRVADVGISDVLVEDDSGLRQEMAELETIRARMKSERENLLSQLADKGIGRQGRGKSRLEALETELLHVTRRLRLAADRARDCPAQIRFMHNSGGELFDFDDESDGTRSWLRLLPVVLTALDTARTLVVDEIDTSLHPKLTAQLVRLFRDPETNPRRAQLIFSTHDTSLLGTMLGEEVLARDQVWFMEKGQNGASNLFPLTDFHPRKGENTERRYLGGSYGAVPVLSDREFADAVLGRNVAS
ncbi:hypothetical protein BC739_002895 [Kutzneria viridogrisea]|uniref:ATPase AAA-type core domain-containing protein n=1 Tax=Kutzneria viridogrisea TaxID=47990 RepID=A0ABR6BFP0_9PSEU|nr:ATP-binding protein [Kutzneria albida]MBA8925696.1 hypothetical protein [Kutzneria viridogrisea]